MRATRYPSALRTAMKSLWHHVLFFLVFVSLPVSILFIVWAYQDHELNAAAVVRIVSAWSVAGIVAALLGWYVILAPYRRRSGNKED